jgi:hypothetical protein
VTGSLVTAWVEVAFDGLGWVTFDPTPPVTNKPRPQKPQEQPDTQAPSRLPPPVIVQPAAQLPPPDPQSQATNRRPAPGFHVPHLVVLVAGYVGIPLAVIGATAGVPVGLKARRRRIRRSRGSTSRRIAGGWLELADRARDFGIRVPTAATRREAAAVFGSPAAARLAARADSAIFGAGSPSEEDTDSYWAEIGLAAAELAAGRSRRQRLLAALNPTPLLAGVRGVPRRGPAIVKAGTR